jgi:hypothetical protein
MNNIQTNQLNMFSSVDTFFKNYLTTLTTALPAMADVIHDFDDILSQINEEAKKQGKTVSGITDDKAEAKHELALLTAAVAGAIKAYSNRNALQELSAKVDFHQSEIEHGKDVDAINKARIVLEEAENILTALGTYNINQQKLQALSDAIAKFDALFGKRGSSKAGHTTTTQTLNLLFHTANNLLKHQADELMLMLKPDNPQLYAEYVNVRQIIDLGSRSKPTPQAGS